MLILTAIVVGVATTALGLAIAVRVYEAYDSVDEEDIAAMDTEDRRQENAVITVTDTPS